MLGVYFDYLTAAGIVAVYIVSFFFYSHKDENHKYAEVTDCFVQGTQSQVFTASLTGFMFAFSSALQAYSFIFPAESGLIPRGLPFSEYLFRYIKNFPLDFMIFFVSILSAVYFFKTAALNFDIGGNSSQTETAEPYTVTLKSGFSNKAIQETMTSKISDRFKYSSAHIVFSFMPIIWAFLNTFKCFFDMSRAFHSPVRIYELMSFLMISAYFVSESRMLVGRREISRLFTFAYIAAVIAVISSLPNLIWSSFSDFVPNNPLIVYAVQLALGVYILSRVYSQIRYSIFSIERDDRILHKAEKSDKNDKNDKEKEK